MIELRAKAIEARLLLREVGGGRSGGLGFEGAMHSLMAAVLLGLASRDALGGNAELDPPYAEPAEAARAEGGERRTVVGADRARQAVFAKQPFQRGAAARIIRPRQDLGAEQIAAEGVADGEWIAVVT